MGSKAGWIIAGVLLLGMIGFAVWNLWPRSSGESVNITPEMLEKKEVGISPAEIVGSVPGAPGNAGEDYQKAVELFKANELSLLVDAQNAILRSAQPDEAGLNVLKQIDSQVAAGAAKAAMNYTAMRVGGKFDISQTFEPALELQRVMTALGTLAKHYVNNKQLPEAEKVFQHMFIMGWHMMEERGRLQVVTSGMGIQREALDALAELYKAMDGEKAARLAAIERYASAMEPVREFFRQTGDKKHKGDFVWKTRPEPVDLLTIVEKDKDRSWRVEALLVLGITRYTEDPNGPNIGRINQALEKYAASGDPLEAAAAKAAQALTQQEFYHLGSKR